MSDDFAVLEAPEVVARLRSVVTDLDQVLPTPRQRIKAAIALEAARHGKTYKEVVGQSLAPKLVKARWACMAKIQDDFRLSTNQIAKFFHKGDHTPVLNGIKKHRAAQAAIFVPSTE